LRIRIITVLGKLDAVALPLGEVNVTEGGVRWLELYVEVKILDLNLVTVDVGALHPR
jgi:hypothetical protein